MWRLWVSAEVNSHQVPEIEFVPARSIRIGHANSIQGEATPTPKVTPGSGTCSSITAIVPIKYGGVLFPKPQIYLRPSPTVEVFELNANLLYGHDISNVSFPLEFVAYIGYRFRPGVVW